MIHDTYRMSVVLAMLGICTALSQGAVAATRLGLFVTQEELTIWRQRMTDNVNTINGFTYQSIYQNRLLAHANSFRAQAHPGGDGFWSGYTGAGCVPGNDPNVPKAGTGGTPWSNGNGGWMTRSAFVSLLTGDASYATPVETELLALTNTTTNPGADFGNTSKWCTTPDTSFGSTATVYVLPWAIRIALAYDFLLAANYPGLTAGEKTQIESWLLNVATWFRLGAEAGHNNAASHREIFNTPPTYSCTGVWCTQVENPWYFNGPMTRTATRFQFFNQPAMSHLLQAIVGIQQNNTLLKDRAQKYFKAYIRVGTFDAGGQADFLRWFDCPGTCPGSMWSHHGGAMGALIQIADIFARSGDTSLYDYAHAAEVPGGSGGTVSLATNLDLVARMASKTTQLFSYSGSTPLKLLSWDTDTPTLGQYYDFSSLAANMYYQNANITAAMTRNALGANNNTGGSGCYDAQFGGCFNGVWGFWPDLPFMYGNLEGTVNPYVTGPAAPTCTVTAPSPFPIYDTATTPLTTLAGTASAPGGFGSVAWANDRGGSGGASGTANWTVGSIALQPGTNVLTVTVTDAGAVTGTCQLRVRYQTVADATSNLRMHLRLDDGPGTSANDETANNHDGVLSGAYTWVAGHLGPWAVRIDGPTGLITVTGLLTSPTAVTLEATFRLSAIPASDGDLVSIGSGVFLRISSTAVAGWIYNGTAWQSTSIPWTPDTNWHSLAYMAKAGEQTLYLDGVLRQYTTYPAAPTYTGPGGNTIIGNHCCGGGLTLQGSVDNPRVWTRYLSQVDLQAALGATPLPPVVTITQPTTLDTYTAATSPLTTIAGTATDPDGTVSSVTWTCTPGCGSGTASGTGTWTIPSIALVTGTNNVTVVATDNVGQTSQDSLAVSFPTSTPTVMRLIQ